MPKLKKKSLVAGQGTTPVSPNAIPEQDTLHQIGNSTRELEQRRVEYQEAAREWNKTHIDIADRFIQQDGE